MVGLCVYTAIDMGSSIGFGGVVSKYWTATASYCTVLGFALPMSWFILLCFATAPVYFFSVFATPTLFLGGGAWLAKEGVMVGGVVMVVIGLLYFAYIFYFWKKVLFTKELVRISCNVLLKHPGLIAFGVAQFLVSCVWTLVCFIGLLGVAVKFGSEENGMNWYAALPVALPYFWGAAVVSNVYVVVCGSTLARVYFGHPDSMATSLKNALTYSFGSVCLGALLIAIVQTLQFLAECLEQQAREDGNLVGVILAGCLRCFMDLLEWLVQIFNKYTMAIVSIYHMSFENSGYEACSLIYENGMQVITQDAMTGFVSFVGLLLLGGATYGIGWKVILPDDPFAYPEGSAEDPARQQAVIQWFGVCIGVAVAVLLWSILMFAVDALVTTLLVCYCEDPEPMKGVSKELSATFDEKKKLLLEDQEKEKEQADP